MRLDQAAMPHNTPESRAAAVNAPAWSEGLTVETYPAPVPVALPSAAVGSAVLWGPVRSGKTALAAALLRRSAAAGTGSTFYWNLVTSPQTAAAVACGDAKPLPAPCWFESWSRLLSLHRRQRWDEDGWFDLLEERVAVLVLDDVGVDTGTPFRESFLLRHVEWAATPGRVLILTLNDPPFEPGPGGRAVPVWNRVLGERVTSRVVDRFAVVQVERLPE